MTTVRQIWIFGILAVLSWEDIRTQLLSGRWLGLFLLTGIPVFLIRLIDSGIWAVLSLLPGLLFLLISFLTQGGLGIGDALAILSLGLFLGGDFLCFMLLLGMCLVLLWAIILFLKNRNGKQEFPMLPFLLAGYLGGICLWEL